MKENDYTIEQDKSGESDYIVHINTPVVVKPSKKISTIGYSPFSASSMVARTASPWAEEGVLPLNIVKDAVVGNDSDARKQLSSWNTQGAIANASGAVILGLPYLLPYAVSYGKWLAAFNGVRSILDLANVKYWPSDTENEAIYKRAKNWGTYDFMMQNPYALSWEDARSTWRNFVKNDVDKNSSIPSDDEKDYVVNDRTIGYPEQGIYVNPYDSLALYRSKLLQGKKDHEDRVPLFANDLKETWKTLNNDRVPLWHKALSIPSGIIGTATNILNLPFTIWNNADDN